MKIHTGQTYEEKEDGFDTQVMPFDPSTEIEYNVTIHVPAQSGSVVHPTVAMDIDETVIGLQDYAEAAEVARNLADMGLTGIVVKLWGA